MDITLIYKKNLPEWNKLIMRISKEIKEGVWLSRIKAYFNVRQVIIEVRPGETPEDAWKRHVIDHPEARSANIKVFNLTKYEQTPFPLVNSRSPECAHNQIVASSLIKKS